MMTSETLRLMNQRSNWSASQAMLFNNAPVTIGDCQLEHGFGQIDGHSNSIHGGLLSSTADLHPHVDQCAYYGEKNGRSPSHQSSGHHHVLPEAVLHRSHAGWPGIHERFDFFRPDRLGQQEALISIATIFAQEL